MKKMVTSTYSKRGAKLIEAIGLALTLFAGLLSWTTLQTYKTNYEVLLNSAKLINDEFRSDKTILAVSLEAAVTRASATLRPKTTRGKTPTAYVYAWEDGDVRMAWATQAKHYNAYITKSVTFYEDMNKCGCLNVKDKLLAINKKSEELKNELGCKMNVKDLGRSGVTIDCSQITPEFVEAYTKKQEDVFHDINNLLDDQLSVLSKRKEKVSSRYGIIFGVGSILLLLGKIIEWRHTT